MKIDVEIDDDLATLVTALINRASPPVVLLHASLLFSGALSVRERLIDLSQATGELFLRGVKCEHWAMLFKGAHTGRILYAPGLVGLKAVSSLHT